MNDLNNKDIDEYRHEINTLLENLKSSLTSKDIDKVMRDLTDISAGATFTRMDWLRFDRIKSFISKFNYTK